MAEHFLRLEDARTVKTRQYLVTQRAVDDLVAARGMGIVHGPAGLGKTFAVRSAVERQQVAVSWFDFPGRMTTKAIVERLLEQVTGVPHSGTRLRLEPLLQDELARVPRLFVVDEAQLLYDTSIEYFRHLHDRPEAQFALLFVGGNQCWKRVSRYPMVRSRLWRRVAFKALSETEVLEHIPRFHPLYAKADHDLLLEIDGEFAHGSFRNWAAFTKTAAMLMREHDLQELDASVMQNVFELHGGLAA